MVYCPQCEANLDVDAEDVDEGDVIACDECGSEFEVVGTNPLELSRLEGEEEEGEEEEESEDGDYS